MTELVFPLAFVTGRWTGLATLRRLSGALLIALGGLGIAHASGLDNSVRRALACF